MDWLSRLFEMMPVRGRLDLRCSYGAPWRIDQGPGESNEIPYHAVVGGSAVLEDLAGGRPLPLHTGDILLLPGNPRHVMHDGSGARPKPARNRQELNLLISENAGKGERLDLLCGHFAIAPRTIACCAAIYHLASSCMPAVTMEERTRRNSPAWSP
jgi:AraC family transcriptional regulator, activator of mtrCDE